jgi:hypothetical protein
LLLSYIAHLIVLLLHVDYVLLRVLDLDEEVLNELPIVVLVLLICQQRLVYLYADALFLC